MAAALLVSAAAGFGCNEPRFLIPSSTLRGITIPLPPPSFADEVLVSIDVEGNLPLGFDAPDTRVFLYEKGTGRGYFVFTDTMSFTFYDVLVDIQDNCLETWYVDGIDQEESTAVDYKVVLYEGDEAVEACTDDACSPVDDVGACICLEKWSTGC